MLLQRLQELLRQGNASDVVLRVQAAGTDEVRVFHAHRLLLGLHSELFRELLSNQSEVVLVEPRDCAAVFDKFIRWGGERLVGGELHLFPNPWLLHSQGQGSPGPLEGLMSILRRSLGCWYHHLLHPFSHRPLAKMQHDSPALAYKLCVVGGQLPNALRAVSKWRPGELSKTRFLDCQFQVWGWAQQLFFILKPPRDFDVCPGFEPQS